MRGAENPPTLAPVPTLLVNLGYVLMLCGFLVRDILWLRGLLILAQTSLALYGLGIDRLPMAIWNALFVVINTVWVLRILKERRPVRIPDALRDLYSPHFAALTPQEFLQLWAAGRPMTVTDGPLIREGETPRDLFLIVDGKALVERSGESLGTLGRGRFLADMSFLTGHPASADVRAAGVLLVHAWPQEALRAWKTEKPALYMKLQGVLGADLAAKIRDANLTVEYLTALHERG